MTNSQESDSIAEKPEVVQTEAKSNRWNWKTVIAVTLTAAVNAVSLGSAILQPVRQRLNQWNWRQKTALVTALAITAGSTFYYQRAHAAALLGPILAAKLADFLVKFFIAYALGKTLNSAFAKKLQKTAAATPDGWLYSNREYYERNYSYTDNGATTTEGRSVDAKADTLYHKAYNTRGTDSSLNPTPLDQRKFSTTSVTMPTSTAPPKPTKSSKTADLCKTLGTGSILEDTSKPSDSLGEATSRNLPLKKYRKNSIIFETAGMRSFKKAMPPTEDPPDCWDV